MDDLFLRQLAVSLSTPAWSERSRRWVCSTDDYYLSSVGLNGPLLEVDFCSRSGGILTLTFDRRPKWSPADYFEPIAEILRVTGAIKTNLALRI
jgi:hypothetical protein